MLRLSLAPAAAAAIRAHAEDGYPLEICGLLIGTSDAAGREVHEAVAARNTWESDPALKAALLAGLEATGSAAGADRWGSASAERRYLVSPRDIMLAMKQARGAGMDVVGVYHTHPNHPAVPSEFDLDAAWHDWSYVILSVRGGRVAEFRSWTLAPDERRFVEESIEELRAKS